MGFLDKVKAQTEQVVKQGQDKIDEAQAKRKADGLLRSLGAWYYATQTGRDEGNGPSELARITAELQAHEAEHGPLGGGQQEHEHRQSVAEPGGSHVVHDERRGHARFRSYEAAPRADRWFRGEPTNP